MNKTIFLAWKWGYWETGKEIRGFMFIAFKLQVKLPTARVWKLTPGNKFWTTYFC